MTPTLSLPRSPSEQRGDSLHPSHTFLRQVKGRGWRYVYGIIFHMTDIPLFDENEDAPIPRAREEVRFGEVGLKPYGDGRRVKLNFTLTPFVERPSVDIAVTNTLGHEVASMSLIEAMDTEFEFTIHLRGPQPKGEHTLHLTIFYPKNDDAPTEDRQVVDARLQTFVVESPY